MKKFITLMAVIIAVTNFVSGQDLDEILQKYYEVTGAEKLASLNSLSTRGKIQQSGMEMDFSSLVCRPGKVYIEVTLQGQVMKQGYNGETGWYVVPWSGSLDPVEMADVQLKSMKRQSDLDGMLYNYEEKGYTTTLVGEEDLEGSPVYLVKQVDADGNTFTHYIDAENFVILKTKSEIKIQGSNIEVETYFSNYKPVDGTVMPFSVESKVNGQTQSHIIVEDIAFNEPVNDSIFEKPVPVPKEEETEEEEK